jgi:hypothetical protein
MHQQGTLTCSIQYTYNYNYHTTQFEREKIRRGRYLYMQIYIYQSREGENNGQRRFDDSAEMIEREQKRESRCRGRRMPTTNTGEQV